MSSDSDQHLAGGTQATPAAPCNGYGETLSAEMLDPNRKRMFRSGAGGYSRNSATFTKPIFFMRLRWAEASTLAVIS